MNLAEAERGEWERLAGVTLGEAVEAQRWDLAYGPVGCACRGLPGCCRYRWWQEEQLRRGAHIAVKQINNLIGLRLEQARTNACSASRPDSAPCRDEIGHGGAHTWERWC